MKYEWFKLESERIYVQKRVVAGALKGLLAKQSGCHIMMRANNSVRVVI